MSDFPTDQLPLHVHTWSACGPVGILRIALGSTPPAAFTTTANRATYMPMIIPWEYPVKRVFWVNGSTITTTNVDFGIYTSSGVRLYSTGSTAMVGASLTQYVTPSVPFVLPAGMYYFAWTCSGTTSRGFGNAVSAVQNGNLMGLLSQSTALPLPATATFVTVSSGMIFCGITRTESGF